MARRTRIEIGEDTELDMTPMLDVVFILLIFFIVTSVFVKMPGVEVDKPLALTAAEATPGILVGVDSKSKVWIDKNPYELNEIRPILLGLRDENPKAEGIIIGDAGAEVGIVMGVQEIMTELKIDNVIAAE